MMHQEYRLHTLRKVGWKCKHTLLMDNVFSYGSHQTEIGHPNSKHDKDNTTSIHLSRNILKNANNFFIVCDNILGLQLGLHQVNEASMNIKSKWWPCSVIN